MTTNQNAAKTEYDAAVKALKKFCDEHTRLEPCILDDEYPIRVQFVPSSQLSLFGDENIDENGEVNDLTVTVGLTTTVKSTLKFKMDSTLLKKLIKISEKVGRLYYQAFREEAGCLRKDTEVLDLLRDVLESANTSEELYNEDGERTTP